MWGLGSTLIKDITPSIAGCDAEESEEGPHHSLKSCVRVEEKVFRREQVANRLKSVEALVAITAKRAEDHDTDDGIDEK